MKQQTDEDCRSTGAKPVCSNFHREGFGADSLRFGCSNLCIFFYFIWKFTSDVFVMCPE